MRHEFRLATLDDAEAIRAVYAPYCEQTIISFELVAPTIEQMAGRINKVLERYPWLVCVEWGEIVGYVYAGAHNDRAAYDWSVNVAVYIAQGHHRRGIGRGLYTSLFATLNLQGFYKAFAGITLPNPGSVGLHQAMGFQEVGIYRGAGHKMGSWHDVGWYQMSLRPEENPPRTLRKISDVVQTREFSEALARGLEYFTFKKLGPENS